MKKDNQSIWILTLPRSGSIYLCGMFNRVGLRPPITEYYNYKRLNKNNLYPVNNKVQPFQLKIVNEKYEVYFQNILDNIPKNVAWIYLRRKNDIERLTSYYIHIQTRISAVSNEKDLNKLKRFKFIVNDKNISKIKEFVERQKKLNPTNYWDFFIKKHNLPIFELWYEDICFKKIKEVFDFCGFSNMQSIAAYKSNPYKIMRNQLRVEYDKLYGVIEQIMK